MNTPARLQALERSGPLGPWAVEQILQLTLRNLRLAKDLEAAQARVAEQEQQLQQKDQQIEQLQREAHRQAAPFRRPEAQRHPHPARPGRKPGHPGAYRPKPDHKPAKAIGCKCGPCCARRSGSKPCKTGRTPSALSGVGTTWRRAPRRCWNRRGRNRRKKKCGCACGSSVFLRQACVTGFQLRL